MAFRDFTYPGVQVELGLTVAEESLFGAVPPLDLPVEFVERMRAEAALGMAIDTEKARSEFIIAPIPSQLRRMLGNSFGLFSGVLFDVDASRGLVGFCDFILTRSRLQTIVTAPVVAIAEAKNDNVRNGLGQCIAGMVAAREFNAREQTPITTIHGVVTTGSQWKFLRLVGNGLTLDLDDYSVVELGRVMGILAHVVRG